MGARVPTDCTIPCTRSFQCPAPCKLQVGPGPGPTQAQVIDPAPPTLLLHGEPRADLTVRSGSPWQSRHCDFIDRATQLSALSAHANAVIIDTLRRALCVANITSAFSTGDIGHTDLDHHDLLRRAGPTQLGARAISWTRSRTPRAPWRSTGAETCGAHPICAPCPCSFALRRASQVSS